MVTFVLLCALILVAGKEDEKEMEFDRWVLELVVEHAKRDLLCSGEASPGSCKRDEAHIFFLFLSLPTMELGPVITLWD